MTKSILIVEGEETLRESIKRTFENEGFTVDGAKSAEEGLALLEATAYDVVLSDIILPGMDALGLLTKARELRPEQIFIVLADHASIDASVEALRAGAYDFLIKPALHEEVKQTVRNALLQKDLQAENAHLKRELNQRLLVSGDDPVQGPSFEGRSLDRSSPSRTTPRPLSRTIRAGSMNSNWRKCSGSPGSPCGRSARSGECRRNDEKGQERERLRVIPTIGRYPVGAFHSMRNQRFNAKLIASRTS